MSLILQLCPQVEDVIAALPHDAHPMGVLLCGLSALSCAHPEQNPAMAGQNIYKSREVQVRQAPVWVGSRVGSCWVGLWLEVHGM
jgi:citrate synthase